MGQLLSEIKDTCGATEQARVLTDLFFVSVLLDAGAGDKWTFEEPGTGNVYERSEGIAVASLYMFKAGTFSSSDSEKLVVNGMSYGRCPSKNSD